MGRLDEKTVLITGAAQGTGEVIARLFAREGAKLVLGGSFITTTADSGFLEPVHLENADFVSNYEGEETFPALLRCLQCEWQAVVAGNADDRLVPE